jgi:hypothetical protein
LRQRLLVGLLAVVTLAAPSPVRAQRSGVIAPLNPLGISPQEARRVQRWVTAAATSIREYRWLASSRLARVLRQAQYRDCQAEVGCLASAGQRVGADVVVAGDVGSLSGAYMVYLKLVDGGKVARTVNGVLDPQKRGLRDTVRGLAFQLLAPEQHVGTIEVKVDVPNAWIYLDGHRVARSPRGSLERIKVGTHALRVTHEAYRDFVRFVKVGFRETREIQVELSAFPVGSGRMKLVKDHGSRPLSDSELPWYRRWWAVAGFGAVVLAATTTAVALLANRSISRDSEAVVPP